METVDEDKQVPFIVPSSLRSQNRQCWMAQNTILNDMARIIVATTPMDSPQTATPASNDLSSQKEAEAKNRFKFIEADMASKTQALTPEVDEDLRKVITEDADFDDDDDD